MTTTTATKEMAAALRKTLKASGTRGRVQVTKDMERREVVEVGNLQIAHFTPDEIRSFCSAARGLGLTLKGGREIDPEAMTSYTNKNWWNFYLPRRSQAAI